MTATPLDLVFTAALMFLILLSVVLGLVALPWTEAELQASAKAAQAVGSLPRLAWQELRRRAEAPVVEVAVAPVTVASLAPQVRPEAA